MAELIGPDLSALLLASVILTGILWTEGAACRQRQRVAADAGNARTGPVVGLVIASCAAALAGVMVTATSTLDTRNLEFGYLTDECQLSPRPYLLGSRAAADRGGPPVGGEFHIRREDLFKIGLDKSSEYHDYLEGLLGLAAIAVGVGIVTTARFFFAAGRRAVYPVLPRASVALGLATCSFVALVASHHLLFIIVNAQFSLLGSGYAYCYANFWPVYRDLFWMIVFAGTSAIGGLLVLPEALRLSYRT